MTPASATRPPQGDEPPGLRIALVDDDTDYLQWLAHALAEGGHRVECFEHPLLFQQKARRDTFDMVLLDWVMPGMSGLDLLAWLRATRTPQIPVIMITSRTESCDIALALELGADDYLVKPFAETVLLARIKALARRSQLQSAPINTISVKHVTLDLVSNRAWLAGEEIELTAKDIQLARVFLTNIGRPLSRAYLLDAIWGRRPDLPTRTLDVHTSRLRTKLNLRPETGFLLTTIYGFGYRLEILDDTYQTNTSWPTHLDSETRS